MREYTKQMRTMKQVNYTTTENSENTNLRTLEVHGFAPVREIDSNELVIKKVNEYADHIHIHHIPRYDYGIL